MKQKQIQINNQKVTYKQAGRGEPVLILHGWGADSTNWVATARMLKEKGFKVIIPDLPGFGKSDEPRKAWNLSNYLQFISSFKKELSLGKIRLIGHSFGGRIAIKAAAEDKLDLEKLVLVSAAGIRHEKNWRQKIGTKISSFFKKIPIIKNIRFLRKTFAKIIGAEDYFKASPVMKKILSKVVKEDLTESLKEIKDPTLIVWGEKDKLTPLADGEKMAAEIERSQLKTFPKGTHAFYRKRPKKFINPVVSFLKD